MSVACAATRFLEDVDNCSVVSTPNHVFFHLKIVYALAFIHQ